MRSHDRTVEHEIDVVPVRRQVPKHALPHSGPRPAGKAFMDALPVAVARWEVTPPRPAPQDPQDAVDEPTIIDCRPAAVRALAG